MDNKSLSHAYEMPCLNGHGEPHSHKHEVAPHRGDIVEKLDANGATAIGVVVEPHPDLEIAAQGWWFVRLISEPYWNSYAYHGMHESQLRVLDCVEVHHTQVTPERATGHKMPSHSEVRNQ